MARHPSTEQIVRWFDNEHQREDLRAVSGPFKELADTLLEQLPDSPELSAGLRKLLESKDCAVRAAVAKREEG